MSWTQFLVSRLGSILAHRTCTVALLGKRCHQSILAVISLFGERHFFYDLKLTKNVWRHVDTYISDINLRTDKWQIRKKVRKFRVKIFLKFRHFTSISLAFCYFEGDIRYIQSPSKYKGNTSKWRNLGNFSLEIF